MHQRLLWATHWVGEHLIVAAARFGVLEHAVLDTPGTRALALAELVEELLGRLSAARADSSDSVGNVVRAASRGVDQEVLLLAASRDIEAGSKSGGAVTHLGEAGGDATGGDDAPAQSEGSHGYRWRRE